MRALVYDGTAARLVEQHPEPTPAEGEVVITVHQAGVTRLDLGVCRGLLQFAGVLGHQFVGTVASSPGRRDLAGRRVVASPICACGRCERCAAGLTAHCRNRTMPGLEGRDGCFAERLALPATSLVVVPEAVDDDLAVFAVPVAAAIQAAQQLTIKGKPYVTVLGDGRLGLLTGQVMARLNASVRVVGRHPAKLELCERWGLKHRHIDEVGRRADQDVVIDCTGTHQGVLDATGMIRPRGTIVLKSLVAPDARSDSIPAEVLEFAVRNEITLQGSGPGPITEALALLARREVDALPLIGRRLPLRDGPAALHAAAQPESLGVIIGCAD